VILLISASWAERLQTWAKILRTFIFPSLVLQWSTGHSTMCYSISMCLNIFYSFFSCWVWVLFHYGLIEDKELIVLIFLYLLNLLYVLKCNLFCFFFLLLWWMRVHCGIYECSYNISNIQYFNSLCLPFCSILPTPISGSFNRYHFHFHKCMHSICTIFALLHNFPTTSPSHWYQSLQAGPVLPSYSPISYKKR
jgi:hypothetical protein